MSLEELRTQIDDIDKQIVELIAVRSKLSGSIGELKSRKAGRFRTGCAGSRNGQDKRDSA